MRDDREPISTYEQAVSRLLVSYRAYEWLYDTERDLPPEAQIVCDVFWTTEATLRRDLRKAWDDTAPAAPHRRYQGWAG